MVCDKDGVVKDGVWQSCVWKKVCQRWCMTKLCVKDGVQKIVCDGVWKMVCVCQRCGVKDGVWQRCVCERWCVKNSVWQSCVWKMVCQRWCVKDGVDGVWQSADKDGVSQMGCERWCVTKWCVKDSVWQSGVWKMVCGKVVCERWCWWCVKDSVWQSGLCKMVCDKAVWQRWCGTKWCERWCVKVGVSRMVSERWCETNLCEKDSVSKMMWRLCVLRLPRERQPRPQRRPRARRSSSRRLCVLRLPCQRQPRPQRRPRAPQLVQEALCTAPATQKAAAAPSGGHAPPQLLQEALCTAPATRKAAAGPSGGHARRSSSRRLCVLRLPRQRQPRPQRRPRAPQLVQEALCTAAATRKRLPRERQPQPQRRPRAPQLVQEALCTALLAKAAAAPAAATRAAARPGGSVYCACHAKGSRGPSGGHARRSSSRRLCLRELFGTYEVINGLINKLCWIYVKSSCNFHNFFNVFFLHLWIPCLFSRFFCSPVQQPNSIFIVFASHAGENSRLHMRKCFLNEVSKRRVFR